MDIIPSIAFMLEDKYPAISGRSWLSDANYENGNYICKCCKCNLPFIGHKRRVICFTCSLENDIIGGSTNMKFRKKPVVVEATQWFKMGDHPKVRHLYDDRSDDLKMIGMAGELTLPLGRDNYGIIDTLEGDAHLVTPGDWIITGVKGETYACKPDIFDMTYERVEE